MTWKYDPDWYPSEPNWDEAIVTDPGPWPSIEEEYDRTPVAHVLCVECQKSLPDVALQRVERPLGWVWMTSEADFNHFHQGPISVLGGPDSTILVTCGVCRDRVRRELTKGAA